MSLTDNTPVLLCHVACSGGSVIFRTLCQRFDLWGLSEVSQFFRFRDGKKPFSPYDPQALLYFNDWLDDNELEEEFKARIARSFELATRKQKRLLIREHTHSLFFQQDIQMKEDGYSWILNRSEELFGQSCKTIFTFRDPVDSWLGMQHSFPHNNSYSFDEYCRRYNRVYDFVERQSQESPEKISLFKYEDFVTDTDSVIQNVSSTLGLDLGQNSEPQIVSTGNSGRQSNKIGKRSRRSYSIEFLNSAVNSPEYARLVERLDYDNCATTVDASTRAKARFNSVRKKVLNKVLGMGKAGQKFFKNMSVAD